MDFAEALEEFLYEKAIDTAKATQDYYRERLSSFQRDSGLTHIEELTPKAITSYLYSKRHLSPATLANYRRALSVFCNWLYRRKYMASNPFEVLPKAKHVRNQRPSYFTKSQVQAIFAEARRSRNAKRDTALVLLLLDTGMRIGEAANLKLEDIDYRGKTLSITGKTGTRDVPMSSKTSYALKRYITQHRRARTVEQHVFTTNEGKPLSGTHLSERLRKIAQRAGVTGPKLGAHTYRHTFAIHYLKSGGDSFSLQRILGHTTMLMTSVYTRMNSEDLKKLHELHSPAKSLL